MVENMDDAIDLDRLSNELEKFNNMMKEGEDSDGGADPCLDNHGSELDGAPSFLSKYLQSVSKTGNPLLPWKTVNTFIRHKIDSILTSFYEKYGIEDIDSQNLPPFNYIPAKEKLLQHFDTFTGAPFTIQRLCEILIEPGRHYKRTDKLLRGLEKNILVVSTVGRLSDDCSDPQQRSMLFNGLHMTAVRSFRPPLPDHVDKFPIASDDSDMKDDEAGPQQHNGDESGLMENEEPGFEEECLKHDLDEDEMDDLEDELRPRLGCGGALAGALAGTGSSHPALEGYSLSSNSVISVRRKRKEEHKQHALHSKRIRMEHAVREQQLQQEAGLACKEEEEEEEEEDGDEEVVIGPMPLEAMDSSCENRLSSLVTAGKVEGEASSSGSEDEQSMAVENGSPSKSSSAQRGGLPSADAASKASKEGEAPMLTKEEPVSKKDKLPEMNTSVPEEAVNRTEAPQEAKLSIPFGKSDEAAVPSDQTKQDIKPAHKSAPIKAVDATILAEQGEEQEVATAPKPASVDEKTVSAAATVAAEESPMEQDPPETLATDGSKEAGGEKADALKALDSAAVSPEEDGTATSVAAQGIAQERTTAASDEKYEVTSSSTEVCPEQGKAGATEEKVVPKDADVSKDAVVQADAPEEEKVGTTEESVESSPVVTEEPAKGSSEVPSAADSLPEKDASTQ